jgi:hypothetical protein
MTNEKQQTAVEWLIRKLDLDNDRFTMKLINQAKEMEKEQIIKAHSIQYDYSYSQIDPKKITGEDYYNETYGGNT